MKQLAVAFGFFLLISFFCSFSFFVLHEIMDMKQLAVAFGSGFGSALLSYALTYLVMSKKLKFKFSNLKIIVLLLITSLLSGVIQKIILHPWGEQALLLISIPIIVSIAVIYSTYKLSLKQES